MSEIELMLHVANCWGRSICLLLQHSNNHPFFNAHITAHCPMLKLIVLCIVSTQNTLVKLGLYIAL